jgi:hypothetical protein
MGAGGTSMGERLFGLIDAIQPEYARTFTDSILESLNDAQLLQLLEDPDNLKSLIDREMDDTQKYIQGHPNKFPEYYTGKYGLLCKCEGTCARFKATQERFHMTGGTGEEMMDIMVTHSMSNMSKNPFI